MTEPEKYVDPRLSGEWVRWARERLEMRQSELARRTGLSRSHLSGFEHGRRGVSRNVEDRILEALEGV